MKNVDGRDAGFDISQVTKSLMKVVIRDVSFVFLVCLSYWLDGYIRIIYYIKRPTIFIKAIVRFTDMIFILYLICFCKSYWFTRFFTEGTF